MDVGCSVIRRWENEQVFNDENEGYAGHEILWENITTKSKVGGKIGGYGTIGTETGRGLDLDGIRKKKNERSRCPL